MDLASGMPDLSTRSPPAAAHQGAGLPAKITVAQICPRICISPQKIFRLGHRCCKSAAVSLSSEWERGFTFEYLDLCQSLANIWGGGGTRMDLNAVMQQQGRLIKMNKNVQAHFFILLIDQTPEIHWHFLHSFLLKYVCTCYSLTELDIETVWFNLF